MVVVEEGKARGQALLGANTVRLDSFPRGGGGGMPPCPSPLPLNAPHSLVVHLILALKYCSTVHIHTQKYT